MTAPALGALFLVCAQNVAPATLFAIISAESANNPIAININGPFPVKRQPRNVDEAVNLARSAINAGYTVDLGLMQVNSANLQKLELSLEQIFDPCTNIRAGAAILTDYYQVASRIHGEGQVALRAALSAYNTGDLKKGFFNGYVDRVISGSRVRKESVPAVTSYTAEITVFTRTPRSQNANK
jgi:type IV secretion system protein VirB1